MNKRNRRERRTKMVDIESWLTVTYGGLLQLSRCFPSICSDLWGHTCILRRLIHRGPLPSGGGGKETRECRWIAPRAPYCPNSTNPFQLLSILRAEFAFSLEYKPSFFSFRLMSYWEQWFRGGFLFSYKLGAGLSFAQSVLSFFWILLLEARLISAKVYQSS